MFADSAFPPVRPSAHIPSLRWTHSVVLHRDQSWGEPVICSTVVWTFTDAWAGVWNGKQRASQKKRKMLEGIDVARGYLRQCCKVPEGVQQEETTGHSRKLPQPSVCSENLGDIWDRFSPWDASQSLPCTSPSSSQLAVAAGNSMTWRVGGWWTVEVQRCAGKASPQSFDGCQS